MNGINLLKLSQNKYPTTPQYSLKNIQIKCQLRSLFKRSFTLFKKLEIVSTKSTHASHAYNTQVYLRVII